MNSKSKTRGLSPSGKTLESQSRQANPLAPESSEEEDFEDPRQRSGAARRKQTRQKLLSAAVMVFAEKGADAPMIDDFIAAAGVARGTFYNHFKTTRELLDAVVGEFSDEVLSSIESRVLQYEKPIERVVCGCLHYMHLAVDNPAWGRFISKTNIRRGMLVDVYLPRDLCAAKELGQLDFKNVHVALDTLLGSMWQGINTVLSGSAPREHIQDVLECVLRGLGVPKAKAARLAAHRVNDIALPELLRPLNH